MRIIDVSRALFTGCSVYEGDTPFVREETGGGQAGGNDPVVSNLRFSAHTGTHVDAPRHFWPEATSRTVEQLALDDLCGRAQVVDCRGRRTIEPGDLAGPLAAMQQGSQETLRVLIRTDGAPPDRPFSRDFPHFSPAAAEMLAKVSGLRLVGIDSPSVDPYPESESDPVFPAHRILLHPDLQIAILEGLDLRGVEAGAYEIWCLPLLIQGAEASPARVVLVDRR